MEKIKTYIETNSSRFLNELFGLIRIPSISSQTEHKEDMLWAASYYKKQFLNAGADKAEIMPTKGNPVVYAEKIIDPAKPTVLVYAHYDVMPVDPIDLWNSPPFEPEIRDGRIYARGADDDKGQGFMHAKAFEQTYGKQPVPTRSGGSIPIISTFEKVLGIKSILMGFGLESDAIHSPNENYPVEHFYKGIETICRFYHFFAEEMAK